MKRFSPFCSAVLLAACLTSGARADDAAGLREIESKHLTLVTDLPADDEVDKLGDYFDQAFDAWCAYFGVDPAQHANWRVRGCLMRDAKRFRAAGLLGDDVPEFPNAYSLGDSVWLHEQTSVYYRRHLLLHEGVHSFMLTVLGGIGPPWYAEGLAELLATHRVDDGKLSVNYFPEARDEVSKWGRIEIVQTAFGQRRAKTLDKIFAMGGTLHADAGAYGWSWAAAAFLDGHPRYRERFRKLHAHVAEPDFAALARQTLAAEPRLAEDWQLFVANVDYGYDFARMDFEPSPGKTLNGTATIEVAADRGWQSSGIAVEPGQTYRLRASGQYIVAHDGQPWVSEPGGVTVDYYHGRPLGMLLAAVRQDDPPPGRASGLVQPIVVGTGTTLKPRDAGTLYLRINDSAGRLGDNSGTARVEITKE